MKYYGSAASASAPDLSAELARPLGPAGCQVRFGAVIAPAAGDERRSFSTTYAETVLDLFDARLSDTPEAPAILCAAATLSYRELDRRARRLAGHLQASGVGRDVVVAIAVERSIEMLVAVLAVLRAGGAYVALDLAYPQQRLDYILADAQPPAMVVRSARRARFPDYRGRLLAIDEIENGMAAAAALAEVSARRPGPERGSLAYVVYTSGSTGKPKGVAIEHQSLVNLIAWQLQASSVGRGERTLQFASLAFDVSLQEIFATWCAGGTLVLVDEPTRRNPQALYDLIDQHRINRLFLPYVALHGLATVAAAREAAPPSLREVVVAGETLRITPQIAALFARLAGCRLVNQYGPAETAVIVTAFAMRGDPRAWPALPPIGRPIDNVRVLILDDSRRPVADGAPGEIHIAGVALARGYLNSPELTAEKFVLRGSLGAGAARLYRTGDLRRRLADGNIEFLGRRDRQVKLRGYRIEPGEIEVVLAQHPRVRQAVVKLYQPAPADKRLVAYVVPTAVRPTVAELLQFMSRKLPAYMVPSLVLLVDAIPLTPSGKIDLAGLPEPDAWANPAAATHVPPRTERERRLAAIWAGVLKVKAVGVTDDFFAIGGDSLLALQLAAEIENVFARTLPLGAIFSAPTIEQLPRALDGEEIAESGFSLVPLQPAGAASPLFFVHWIPRGLVRRLGTSRPIYGLSYGLAAQTAHRRTTRPDRIEDLAAHYLDEMRGLQPRGPYTLVGYSLGGLIAFEMARRLHAEGEKIGFLGLIDTLVDSRYPDPHRLPLPFHRQVANFLRLPPVEIRLSLKSGFERLRRRLSRGAAKRANSLDQLGQLLRDGLWSEEWRTAYVPKPFAAAVTLFTARDPWSIRFRFPEVAPAWRELTGDRVEIREVPGRHTTVILEPNVGALAADLAACLDRVP